MSRYSKDYFLGRFDALCRNCKWHGFMTVFEGTLAEKPCPNCKEKLLAGMKEEGTH